MEMHITKEELFETMSLMLERTSPYIITEFGQHENAVLLSKALTALAPYVLLEYIEGPKQLYTFIKQHQNELIIIKDDIFTKRKNYLDIVQGAVCSSPDSMELWSVSYLNEKDFVFKGKIILCTNKTKKEIKNDKRLTYFARDCNFI